MGVCREVLPFQREPNFSPGKIGTPSAYLVPQVALDDLWKSGKIRPADFIKIDVEGAEHGVLEAAREIVSQNSIRIVLSLHGDDQKRRCSELLRERGYVL